MFEGVQECKKSREIPENFEIVQKLWKILKNSNKNFKMNLVFENSRINNEKPLNKFKRKSHKISHQKIN